MARKVISQRSIPVYAIAKGSGKLVLIDGVYQIFNTEDKASVYAKYHETVVQARLVVTNKNED